MMKGNMTLYMTAVPIFVAYWRWMSGILAWLGGDSTVLSLAAATAALPLAMSTARWVLRSLRDLLSP